MADLKRREFFVLRYVPDLLKGEFVNFGVVLLDPSAKGGPHVFSGVRFTSDWRRLKCIDPNADLEMLQALETDLRRGLGSAQPREEMLRVIEQFSNTIQVSPRQACETSSPEHELERIAREYLESPAEKGERSRQARGRMAIYFAMRSEFQRVGVWDLMRKRIGAASYTHPGDTLEIDCGYGLGGVVKLFQAVSFQGDLDPTKALAFSYPRIADGMKRNEKAEARLTAVVESYVDPRSDTVAFGLETCEHAKIAVAPISELRQLADLARKELRA